MKMFDEIVFEKRNKEYGAYQIRKSYGKNTILGLLISIFLVGSVLAIPYLKISAKDKPTDTIKVTELVLDKPPVDDVPEVPKASKPEMPKMETIKFTVPIITDKDIDSAVTAEDLLAVNPGLVNQHGDSTFVGIGDTDGTDQIIGEDTKEEIFTFVEVLPEYPGGVEAMFKFLDQNLGYPQMARDQTIQGTVYVQFVIDKVGNVSQIEVLRGIGGGCDEEAIRVVQLMPRWIPGKNNGRSVSVKFRLPIKFSLR